MVCVQLKQFFVCISDTKYEGTNWGSMKAFSYVRELCKVTHSHFEGESTFFSSAHS